MDKQMVDLIEAARDLVYEYHESVPTIGFEMLLKMANLENALNKISYANKNAFKIDILDE